MALAKVISILSVEDHPVFREGLRTIIESQPDMLLIGQAANFAEALAQFRRRPPDVTLMDMRLPGGDGIEAMVAIRREFPEARIIILTSSETDGEIQHVNRRPRLTTFRRRTLTREDGVVRIGFPGLRYLCNGFSRSAVCRVSGRWMGFSTPWFGADIGSPQLRFLNR